MVVFAQKLIHFSSTIGNGTVDEQRGDVVEEADDPEPGEFSVQAEEPVGDRQRVG